MCFIWSFCLKMKVGLKIYKICKYFLSACFIWMFCHYLIQRVWEGLLVTYIWHCCHFPALFMTSLTQTAGYKMAALTATFSFQLLIFNKQEKLSKKTAVCIFFFFCTIDKANDATSVQSTLNGAKLLKLCYSQKIGVSPTETVSQTAILSWVVFQ